MFFSDVDLGVSVDKPQAQELVLASFPFLDDSADDKWRGAIELVQRDLVFADGNRKQFTDLRIRIGTRWLPLPRRGIKEILKAMEEGERALQQTSQPRAQAIGATGNPPKRKQVFEADQLKGRKKHYQEYDE